MDGWVEGRKHVRNEEWKEEGMEVKKDGRMEGRWDGSNE
jgi:hypothetical protein